ncbi:putative mitochondrial oligo U binding protein TBRGG1 [Leptomonas seymouri]|nr:putative mitochondrial oligo U binding protein TBRGG1 [Leptomonas seymouri]|eukprot:KPI88703.1 putative mitochondrial oligo U binding protein TBRGG1 [Leptomonas seymouri]
MRKALSPAVQRLQPVRPYSTLFSPSLAVLQRGNSRQGGGGPRYGNGAPPPRQQYPTQRGGGGGGRLPAYGSRQHGYESRDGGFGSGSRGHGGRERGAYGDNRRQGFGDRQHGYDDRARGSLNRDRDSDNRQRNGGFGGRSPRRSASDYLSQNAETLLQMKRAYKQSKSTKERVQILREARRLIRRTHVDMSTQDERSVIVFLNCATTFKSRACDGLEEASRWVQANLRGLSPQNVALYANALGVLDMENRREVFRAAVVPLLPSLMREMTPVEVVMVLQAFQRMSIDECGELVDELLFQLEPCIPTMPVPQLSTLAKVLTEHSLHLRDAERWRQVVQAVLGRAMESVETMHSKEAVAFLCAAPKLGLPPEQLCRLLARATVTAGFHNDEQVVDLFRAVSGLKRSVSEPTPELEAAVTALSNALLLRLEKVAPFLSVDGVATILLNAVEANIELPTTVVQVMCDAVLHRMTYRTTRMPTLAHLARAFGSFKLPSRELLDVVAKYAVGERPPRPQKAAAAEEVERDDDAEAEEEVESLRTTTLESLYRRYFNCYVLVRLHLEEAYAKLGENPPEELTTTLPESLLQHISSASARHLFVSMEAILTKPPGCPCRNVSNDEALYQGVLKDIASTPEKYKSSISPAFVDRMQRIQDCNPKGKVLNEALQRALL